ncbi:hypothetical protein NOR_05709 [Metarhizium rileyi]|uniref:Uncharacterized protein n=1 Tax=Metarhizium rileyi (strain RCEF 4871) TaxID=1649241 RepID=A0A167C008_METRR|nr:hypothetical protein NOR_05709 [Metarhizium rileyi RCEF 4871]
MSEVLDLRKDTIFNAKVTEAKYDKKANHWTLTTSAGHEASARHVIFVTGTSNKTYVPQFAGIEQYKGVTIHPANWPKGFHVKGKRVGSVAIPMRQRSFSGEEMEENKNTYQALFAQGKYNSDTGFPYNFEKRSFYDLSPEEREQQHEMLWNRGGFVILTSNFQDQFYDKAANAELYQFWARKVRARINYRCGETRQSRGTMG